MGEPELRGDRTISFFGVLNHRIRVRIIEMLFDNTELTYTDILNNLGISDGKLNFHLRKMKDFLLLEDGNYRLSQLGLYAHKYLLEIRSEYGYRPKEDEKRLLIVDDDVGMCETLTDIFEKKGYVVDSVQTGTDAISRVKERFYNVALIDIKLPDFTGTDLLIKLRSINPHLAPIMITAYASLESSIDAINRGAYSYLLKPLDMDKTLSTVKKAFESQVYSKEEKGPTFKLANVKLRFLASVLDVFIIFIMTGSFIFFYANIHEALRLYNAADTSGALRVFINSVYLYSSVFIGSWLLFTVLEGYKGETLGKFLLGLRVVKRDGSKISFADAAVRNLGKVFLLPLDLLLGMRYRKFGYFRFFDYYTKSTVVHTREIASPLFNKNVESP